MNGKPPLEPELPTLKKILLMPHTNLTIYSIQTKLTMKNGLKKIMLLLLLLKLIWKLLPETDMKKVLPMPLMLKKLLLLSQLLMIVLYYYKICQLKVPLSSKLPKPKNHSKNSLKL